MLVRACCSLLLLLLCHAAAAAQTPSCGDNLDSLDVRIRRNYAGYLLEVKGTRAREHEDTLAALRRAARAAGEAACLPVLQALTDWFDDPHLFIYQNADADTAAALRARASLQRTDWTAETVAAYLRADSTRLDPIEGVWYDGDLRVGVVRERADTFIAIVLAADTITWPAGAVRARFQRAGPGRYLARLHTRRFGTRTLEAGLHRNALLRFSPGTWGKAYPLPAADSGFLDPGDPRRPTLRIVDGAPVFTLPSHDPRYAPVLDSLVRANAVLLETAARLVIDLRGNEGGSSFTSRSLEPYVASATGRVTPFDRDSAVMLSSPDQVRYAQRAFGPDTTPFVRSLVARLTARPGELVALREGPRLDARPPVAPGDRRVAVLVDRGTVSAAEVLVLHALRSTRARVFGEPTAGALDYQSTSIVRLSTDESRWLLGYPTITRHPALPEGGMRGRGIAPDVAVRWDEVPDPVRWVLRRLDIDSP